MPGGEGGIVMNKEINIKLSGSLEETSGEKIEIAEKIVLEEREKNKILSRIKECDSYKEFNDLVAFSVGATYLCIEETSFQEIVVAVEKEYLFHLMQEQGIEDPIDYLKNEYTWDDSIIWFERAAEEGKIAVTEFC